MLTELIVSVSIRKGLGPEWFTKNFSVGFDDLPEETTSYEVRQMAIREVEEKLYGSEDYPRYGKNWVIQDVESI